MSRPEPAKRTSASSNAAVNLPVTGAHPENAEKAVALALSDRMLLLRRLSDKVGIVASTGDSAASYVMEKALPRTDWTVTAVSLSSL